MDMKRGSLAARAKWLLAAATTGALLAAVGSVAYAQQTIPENETEFSFSNPDVTVRAGERVTFTLRNVGQFPHNMEVEDAPGVVVSARPAENVGPGATGQFVVSFSQPGTYEFWCPVGTHRDRGMTGTITVAGAQAAGAAGRAGGLDPATTAGALGALGALSLGAGFLRRRRA
jgi:uncharacterized cupredoxin-like copper-binding protein